MIGLHYEIECHSIDKVNVKRAGTFKIDAACMGYAIRDAKVKFVKAFGEGHGDIKVNILKITKKD